LLRAFLFLKLSLPHTIPHKVDGFQNILIFGTLSAKTAKGAKVFG